MLISDQINFLYLDNSNKGTFGVIQIGLSHKRVGFAGPCAVMSYGHTTIHPRPWCGIRYVPYTTTKIDIVQLDTNFLMSGNRFDVTLMLISQLMPSRWLVKRSQLSVR